MLDIKTFLSDIKINDKNIKYLNYIWEEIEKYINVLTEYSVESQNTFLVDYLIKENAKSSNIEGVSYLKKVLDLYNSCFFERSFFNEKSLQEINKTVRSIKELIPEDKYIHAYNKPYEQYKAEELMNLTGRFRTEIVWLGPTNNKQDAKHIPPKPQELDQYIKDFLSYYNDEFEIKGLTDPLVKAALLHVIFIKIHPFANGNGRTARLLLNEYIRTSINKKYNLNFLYPLLNLSSSFIISKSAYNENQNNIIFKEGVDNNEAFNNWIKYILERIEEQLYFLNNRITRYSDLLKNKKYK